MGGAVFAPDGIDTPRIPSATYEQALHRVEQQLRQLFETVQHALLTPEKQDHGDLDILALAPTAGRPGVDAIAFAINAVKYRVADFTNGIYHFAVPWAAKAERVVSFVGQNDTSAAAAEECKASSEDETLMPNEGRQTCIQVDLTVCATKTELQWRLFAYSHGDAMNILGSIIRRKGFTLTNQALYLRLGLDTNNKKLNRTKLSSDVDEVLNFLRMNKSRFWTAFETQNSLMAYLSTCRFFDAKHSLGTTEEERLELDKRALDKSRMEFRPLFRFWYKDWLPQHQDDQPSEDAHMSKEEAAEDTFRFFGDDVRQMFDARHKELSTMLAGDKFWATTKTMLANGHVQDTDLNDTMRALRKELIPPATATRDDDNLTDLHRAYLAQDFDKILDWISANHASVLAQWKAEIEERRSRPQLYSTSTKLVNTHLHL